MAPRYEVIADYPGSRYKIGELVNEHPEFGFDIFPYPAKHSHIFRLVMWWEFRVEANMPKFVRWIEKHWEGRDLIKDIIVAEVVKTTFDKDGIPYFDCGDFGTVRAVGVEPATEQEYNDYLNSKP